MTAHPPRRAGCAVATRFGGHRPPLHCWITHHKRLMMRNWCTAAVDASGYNFCGW